MHNDPKNPEFFKKLQERTGLKLAELRDIDRHLHPYFHGELFLQGLSIIYDEIKNSQNEERTFCRFAIEGNITKDAGDYISFIQNPNFTASSRQIDPYKMIREEVYDYVSAKQVDRILITDPFFEENSKNHNSNKNQNEFITDICEKLTPKRLTIYSKVYPSSICTLLKNKNINFDIRTRNEHFDWHDRVIVVEFSINQVSQYRGFCFGYSIGQFDSKSGFVTSYMKNEDAKAILTEVFC